MRRSKRAFSGRRRGPAPLQREVQAGSGSTHDEVTDTTSSCGPARRPLTQIADNAGVDGGVICEKVSELDGNKGYNAATGKFEDLVKTGIIDPTKVTRTALTNAASVATLLLTSDALVAEKPKDEKKGHGDSHDDLY